MVLEGLNVSGLARTLFFFLSPLSMLASLFIVLTYMFFALNTIKYRQSPRIFILWLSICDFLLSFSLILQYIVVGHLEDYTDGDDDSDSENNNNLTPDLVRICFWFGYTGHFLVLATVSWNMMIGVKLFTSLLSFNSNLSSTLTSPNNPNNNSSSSSSSSSSPSSAGPLSSSSVVSSSPAPTVTRSSFLSLSSSTIMPAPSSFTFTTSTTTRKRRDMVWPYHLFVWSFAFINSTILAILDSFGPISTGCYINGGPVYRMFFVLPLLIYFFVAIAILLYSNYKLKMERSTLLALSESYVEVCNRLFLPMIIFSFLSSFYHLWQHSMKINFVGNLLSTPSCLLLHGARLSSITWHKLLDITTNI
eukprot:TRINITY_DN11514_c1_g1_i2.p1 TRINITY_DN11514_c1_g1~~TRINITY_DN11514_c1_g1_i2.p1  ORF type:complete len:396 (+),score=85.05 TRINITY_DN11514_c1_g1_i2:105-1190(+)